MYSETFASDKHKATAKPMHAWGLSALLCGILVSTAVGAQEPAQTTAETSPAAAYTAMLVAQLKLSPQQEVALLAFEVLLADAPRLTSADLVAFQALSLPRRMDFMADHAAADVPKIRAAAQAAQHFYDLLSVDQRKAIDAIMSPRQPTVAPPTATTSAPVAPNFQLPGHTDPDWLAKPTVADISRVYPRAARLHRVSGRVLLGCMVDAGGYLSDCAVSEETPQGAGFGNAALEMTGYMRMRPATTYGVPVESSVNVPIDFQF